MKPARPVIPAAVCVLLLLNTVSGSFPQARNLTWKSTNFKTILTWGPEPSEEYAYTVQYSVVGQDKQRTRLCFRSSATLCDLSTFLTDLHADYTADVLSEPPLGVTSDLIEFPYTTSPRFCPYKDTEIGRPDFKLKVSEDQKTTTLYVTDPLTALFKDGRQLSIRDIFSDQLQYRVTYRKNKSTGKKTADFKTHVIEMRGLDRGESYCFNVQAFIPSRSFSRQLGEMSQTQCSRDKDQSPFQVYSVGVIAGAIFLILLLIAIIIIATVFCCKRRQKNSTTGKEGGAAAGRTDTNTRTLMAVECAAY